MTRCGSRDGTLPRLAGPKALAEHVVPTITAAARSVGRPDPRITALVPVVVTDEVEAVTARMVEVEAFYEKIPSYRAILDREGFHGPGRWP